MGPRRTAATFVLALISTLAVTLVVPLTPTSSSSTAEAALRKTVTSDYTLLRRGPSSYVIGTAYRGWTVDVHGPASGGYRWGRVFGDLNGCLWIYEGAVAGSGATTDSCSNPGTIYPTWLFTNGQISTGVSDGTSVATVAGWGCWTYDGVHLIGWGNVRPWADQTSVTAGVPTTLTYGSTVRWRYVSRDGAYVMVRDPAGGSTDGTGIQSWFFLPRGCLPSILP